MAIGLLCAEKNLPSPVAAAVDKSPEMETQVFNSVVMVEIKYKKFRLSFIFIVEIFNGSLLRTIYLEYAFIHE